jgi:hypothetical protein
MVEGHLESCWLQLQYAKGHSAQSVLFWRLHFSVAVCHSGLSLNLWGVLTRIDFSVGLVTFLCCLSLGRRSSFLLACKFSAKWVPSIHLNASAKWAQRAMMFLYARNFIRVFIACTTTGDLSQFSVTELLVDPAALWSLPFFWFALPARRLPLAQNYSLWCACDALLFSR